MSANFDPYHKWLGILPKDQPPHHYRLLGVEAFEDDLQVIESAADRQLGYLRKFQSGEHAADCQKLLNEVSRARLCLLKPAAKAAYDEQLRDQLEMPAEELIEFEPLMATSGRPRRSEGPGPVAWASAGVLVLLIIGGLAFLFRGKGPANVPAPPGIADGQPAVTPPGPGSNSVAENSSSGTKPIAGTSVTKPNAQGTIDILPLLKSEHIVKGRWKTEASRLESLDVFHEKSQIQLPVDVPPTYTLHATGTRLTEPGEKMTTLGVGLVCGKNDCVFAMETKPPIGTSGLAFLDGKDWDSNQTTLPGSFTKTGVPFQLDVTVRESNVEIRVDGRTIVDWDGDFSRLYRHPSWNIAEPHKLFLAAESPYVFTKLTIGPPLPRRKLPGGDLKPGESVELLKFVDVKQDVWNGEWLKDGPIIKCAGVSQTERFSVPYQVPEEYELIADLQIDTPGDYVFLGFPFQRGYGSIGIGGTTNDNVLFVDYAALFRDPSIHHPGRFLTEGRNKIAVTVRKNHLSIKVGDTTLFDWHGDARRFYFLHEWSTPGSRITLGSNRCGYRVHSLKLTRLAPVPDPFPKPTPPRNGDLLGIVNLDRDTTYGVWTKTERGIQSSADRSVGLHFPATLPNDYEFRFVVESKGVTDALLIAVPVARRRVQFLIDGDKGHVSGIEFMEGKRSAENSTTLKTEQPLLPPGQPAVIQGRVTGQQFVLEVNGKKLWDLAIPASLEDPVWYLRPGWLTVEERLQVCVDTWQSSVEIHEARFRALDKKSPPFPVLNIAGLAKPATQNNPGPAGNPQAAKSPNPDQPLVGEGLLSAGTTPVPDAAAQEAALKKLRELFKEQYANSKKDLEKLALAQKLEKLAEETRDDPNVKFVCLDEARKLAADVGDLAKAFALVETLVGEFKIDAVDMKASTLMTAAPKLKGPPLNKELVDKALPVVDQLILAEQFEKAISLANTAAQAAIKVKDKALQAEVQDVRKEADQLAKEFSQADKARQTLLTRSDDGPARLVWGRWVCLHQGKWAEGLKLLQGAGDEKLTELASRDLKEPTDKEAILQLGSDWLDYARSRKDHSLTDFAARALYWLAKAHTESTGLAKTRIESLMEQAVSTKDWNSPITGLLDAVSKKVAQRKYVMSEESGRPVSTSSQEIPPSGGVLVGLDCYLVPWLGKDYIQGVRPIFVTKTGLKTGELIGLSGGTLVAIRARPGYAVSGLVSQSSVNGFASIQLTFARVTKLGLDPQRRYFSVLAGRPGSPEPSQVMNSGNQAVVGVFGHADEFLRGIGIVTTR
ncbi:MAG: hypothetical protein JWN70_970 [Planctomycetaceae bacterium]|nr:hypothetical protein [Planctomycetaceae bacterium]